MPTRTPRAACARTQVFRCHSRTGASVATRYRVSRGRAAGKRKEKRKGNRRRRSRSLCASFPAPGIPGNFRPMPTPTRLIPACLIAFLTLALASTTLRAADDASGGGWVPLFNGKDLSGWKFRHQAGSEAWKIVSDVRLDPADPKKLVGSGQGGSDRAVLLRGPIDHGTDIYTDKEFGDCELHVEFVVPQRSNSGVYLMGRYEVQVLDSYGKPDERLGPGDLGGIYTTSKPSKNASRAPGQWQTFDIVFETPRFDSGG